MSMCRVFSCVVGRVSLLWSGYSLDKILLSFVPLHKDILYSKAKFACYSRYFLTSYFLQNHQAWRQQFVNHELPDVQAGFRKGRGTRDQTANIHWIIEKAREFQENIYFCFIDYAKAFDCVDHSKLWKLLKEMGIPDHWSASWEICMQIRKQQLELDMEQQTCSKSGKVYIQVVYCHPTYLTYMQSTFSVLARWSPSWNQDCQEKYQ